VQAGIQQCRFLRVEPRDGPLPASRSSIANSSLLVDCHHRGPSAISISRPHRQGNAFRRVFASSRGSRSRSAQTVGARNNSRHHHSTHSQRALPRPVASVAPVAPTHWPSWLRYQPPPAVGLLALRECFPACTVACLTRKLVGSLGTFRVALFAPILGLAVACQWRL
jgi:hypothetical protein